MVKYKNEKAKLTKEKSQAQPQPQPQLPRNGSGNCFVRGNCMKLVRVHISLPLCVYLCVCVCLWFLIVAVMRALRSFCVCLPQIRHCHAIKHLWHLTKFP